MIERRLLLHEVLCKILGSRNVYFKPPESIKMEYPAIRYSLKGVDVKKADNKKYMASKRYTLILMDKNPDNIFVDKLLDLDFCTLSSTYTTNNLNHYVFELYF